MADKDLNKCISGQQLVGIIHHEYNMNESQKKKEAVSHKKNDKANTPLLDRISGPLTGKKGLSSNNNIDSNNKMSCKHCGQDNHPLKKCHFLSKVNAPNVIYSTMETSALIFRVVVQLLNALGRGRTKTMNCPQLRRKSNHIMQMIVLRLHN